MKSASGSSELDTRRDRSGTLDPQFVKKKNQAHLADGLKSKIIALYAYGNIYQSIREHLKDFYDIDLSNDTLNAVTDKLFPELGSWSERDLDPVVIRSCDKKWDNLSAYFKYPEDVRKAIYTTDTVEALHRQFRRLTKPKGEFPNENSLLKLLYAVATGGSLRRSDRTVSGPLSQYRATLRTG